MQTVTHSIRHDPSSGKRNRSANCDLIGVAIRDDQVAFPVRQLLLENLRGDVVESTGPIDGDLTDRLLKSQSEIRRSGSFLDDLVNASIRNDQLTAKIM